MADQYFELELPNGQILELPVGTSAADAKMHQDRFMKSPNYLGDSYQRPAPANVDKYHAAAQKRLADERAHGGDNYFPQFMDDMKRKYTNGASFGWLDDATAAVGAGIHGIGSTMPYDERLKYERAYLDEKHAGATRNTGKLGTLAEIAGGVSTARGLPTMFGPGQNVFTRSAIGSVEGSGYGALTGAGNASPENRGDEALKGAGWGAILGAAAPVVVYLGEHLFSPQASRLMSWVDPNGSIRARVGDIIRRSGATPQDVTRRVQEAHAQGQTGYTYIDALNELGDAGTQAVRAYGRAPGQARNNMVDFLDTRQFGQGGRISGFADEAFGFGGTAQDYERGVRRSMGLVDSVNYPRAAENAGPIDLRPSLDLANRFRFPEGSSLEYGMPSGYIPGRVSVASKRVEEAADLLERLGKSTASGLDYRTVLGVKQRIQDLALEAERGSNEARQLGQLADSLDLGLESATGGPGGFHRHANDTHRMFAEGLDAVDGGRSAYSQTVQPADAATNFSELPIFAQQGARVGFKEGIQTGLPRNPNVNASTPLRSEQMQNKVETFATNPESAQTFNERIARENQMSNTRNVAVGGSPTADILAAQADGGIDPRLGGAAFDAASGNFFGFGKKVLSGIGDGWNGNTEQIRDGVLNTLFNNRLGISEPQSPLPAFVQNLGGSVASRLGLAPRAPVTNLAEYLRQGEQSAQRIEDIVQGAQRLTAPALATGGVTTGREPVPVDPNFSGGVSYNPNPGRY